MFAAKLRGKESVKTNPRQVEINSCQSLDATR